MLESIKGAIADDPANAAYRKKGYQPLFSASSTSRLVIIGLAPGQKTQEVGQLWRDKSGDVLRSWLGLSTQEFYNERKVALLPMDFYFLGKGKSGDIPPRQATAVRWHPVILAALKEVRLTILLGTYAQKYYLAKRRKKTLTETVRSFNEYLPEYFPLVHSSPLNFRWQSKNPWFLTDVVPRLQEEVARALA